MMQYPEKFYDTNVKLVNIKTLLISFRSIYLIIKDNIIVDEEIYFHDLWYHEFSRIML